MQMNADACVCVKGSFVYVGAFQETSIRQVDKEFNDTKSVR